MGTGSGVNKKNLIRFVVFVYHPQTFFFPWGNKYAVRQDRLLFIANKLAKIDVVEDFYQQYAWESKRNFQKSRYYEVMPSLKDAESQAGEAVATQSRKRASGESSKGGKSSTNVGGLIRSEEECSDLPKVLKIWCQRCLEKTKTSALNGGGNIWLDTDTRWTKGNPAKYIERIPICLNCPTKARFITVDPNIPSIPLQMLERFESQYAYMDDEYLISLLAVRAPSPREYRYLKTSSKWSHYRQKNYLGFGREADVLKASRKELIAPKPTPSTKTTSFFQSIRLRKKSGRLIL